MRSVEIHVPNGIRAHRMLNVASHNIDPYAIVLRDGEEILKLYAINVSSIYIYLNPKQGIIKKFRPNSRMQSEC